MKDINVPLENFDLDGFINKTMDFLKAQASEDLDPSGSIYWVESPGRCPHDEGEKGWDFRSKLLEGKVFLFFPFGFSDLEGSFDCADGNSYTDRSGEAESAEDEDDDCLCGDDIIGYLARVNDGSISIQFAICALAVCLPPPTVDLLTDCRVLEQPITQFIQGFVN